MSKSNLDPDDIVAYNRDAWDAAVRQGDQWTVPVTPAQVARARAGTVFTTHTPVPAGNETYGRDEVLPMLGWIADLTGDRERFLALGRVDPSNPDEPSGMTVLALRASGAG